MNRKNAEGKVSIQGQKNVKKLKMLKKLRLFMFHFRFWVIFGVCESKNTLNLNKILIKAKFIEKFDILLYFIEQGGVT